jgi:hypothetical protein
MAIASVSIRSGSDVNRGVVRFTRPTILKDGDLEIRPTLRNVAVSRALKEDGTPMPGVSKQPNKTFAPVPVRVAKYDTDSTAWLIGFSLFVDTVFGLFYKDVEIFTGHQLLGDMDGNGNVDEADFATYTASLDKPIGSEFFRADMDLDGSGFVDAGDLYQLVRQIYLGTQWTYTA